MKKDLKLLSVADFKTFVEASELKTLLAMYAELVRALNPQEIHLFLTFCDNSIDEPTKETALRTLRDSSLQGNQFLQVQYEITRRCGAAYSIKH
jgi:hypothetical protein